MPLGTAPAAVVVSSGAAVPAPGSALLLRAEPGGGTEPGSGVPLDVALSLPQAVSRPSNATPLANRAARRTGWDVSAIATPHSRQVPHPAPFGPEPGAPSCRVSRRGPRETRGRTGRGRWHAEAGW